MLEKAVIQQFLSLNKRSVLHMKMGELGRTVNLGVIGVGGRGWGQVEVLAQMKDVCIKVICDKHQDRVDNLIEYLHKENLVDYPIDGTLVDEEVLCRDDIEAVVIMSDWETHIDLAIRAMRHGKYVAMEVGGAASVNECWEMVRTAQQTGLDVMLLENCCYNNEEMALLNMVRAGVFGEIVHCKGGYQHDLRDEIGWGDENRHYRLHNFLNRNGELYPTHEMGPIAKYLDLNYGNRMVSLVSMASKAVGMNDYLRRERPDCAHANATFREGDIVTTMIKCANGETIVLTHDCTLPRPYSRGGHIQGTRGLWQEDNRRIYIEGEASEVIDGWLHVGVDDKEWMDKYKSDLWKEYEEFGLRGGHGGMDYLVFRGFIEALQQKTHFPIDVYDTAAWMAITALSEDSIANGSMPVAFPDFTDGKWMLRKDEAVGPYKLGK